MKKILVIQLRQLGDILLTTPVFYAIQEKFPNAEIDFLCHRSAYSFVQKHPCLRNIFTYDGPNDLQFLKALRAQKYDFILDFMNTPRSALITALIGAKERWALGKSRIPYAYTKVVPRPEEYIYVTKEKFLLLADLGLSFEFKKYPMYAYYSDKDVAAVDIFLKNFPANEMRIALSATHRRETRKWPGQNYVRIAEYLVKHHNAQVFWLYGPGEKAEVEALQKACSVQTFLAIEGSLCILSAFLKRMKLVIANCNGPSHFAVAQNIPLLKITGPSPLAAWCPMTDQFTGIQSKSHIIADVSVEEVINAVQRLIPSRK